jgi:hypothetical protein
MHTINGDISLIMINTFSYIQIAPLMARVDKLMAQSVDEGNLFDLPNGHSLLELVHRQLPYLRNCIFARTNLDERHHRRGKRNALKKTKNKPLHTMFQYNIVSTTAYLLNGGRWGPNMQYIMSQAVREMTLNGKVHPLILKVGTYTTISIFFEITKIHTYIAYI